MPPPLRWPADFGSHPEARIEWWYLTGSLAAGAGCTSQSTGTNVSALPADVKAQIEEIIAVGRNRSKVLFQWGFNETIPTG